MGINPQDFEKMRKRLNGAAKRGAEPLLPALGPTASPRHQVVIGIDPSLRGTGFGVIRFGSPHPQVLVHGTVSCPAGWERSRCLAQIAATLREQIRRFQPTAEKRGG